MNIELLNLVKAKRVAGDVQWLSETCLSHLRASPESVRQIVRDYVHKNTGYANALIWAAVPEMGKIDLYAFLLGVLIRRDYDKLSLGANQSEAEHVEILGKLNEILQSPDLCAKIQISVHLHKP